MISDSEDTYETNLFIPGINVRALEKLGRLGADSYIIDLEDAIAKESKEAARINVAKLLTKIESRDYKILVRINDVSTKWYREDLESLVGKRVEGIVIPKVESTEDIDKVRSIIGGKVLLWSMIETSKGVLNVEEIGGSGELRGFIYGSQDLSSSLGVADYTDNFLLPYAVGRILVTARANNLLSLAGVYMNIKDSKGFEKQCRQDKLNGFHGKTLIHPTQIALAKEIYLPSSDEYETALKIVKVWRDKPSHEGVVTIDGQLIEHFHVREAEKLIQKVKDTRA